uniref:Uncharacterized protein LOC104213153 n=1 Tax=Nicotiana sylvestris TaxID=4096 RepID=A0A1U7V3C1_NICSY|nr:PREDICTED: uncharacterized protein LOC104213153 [Nicotiana sylvestris]
MPTGLGGTKAVFIDPAAATYLESGRATLLVLGSLGDSKYLKNIKLPSDPKESRALRTKAAQFTLSEDGTLFSRMFDGPLAICLGLGDIDYVLREFTKELVEIIPVLNRWSTKVIRARYYWTDMEKDAKGFVRKCDKCQSGNGQAELTNKTIIQNFKKRLTDAKRKWREILPKVLWAYRTTSKSSTGATPFSLGYGTEALIPVKVGEPSIRF